MDYKKVVTYSALFLACLVIILFIATSKNMCEYGQEATQNLLIILVSAVALLTAYQISSLTSGRWSAVLIMSIAVILVFILSYFSIAGFGCFLLEGLFI